MQTSPIPAHRCQPGERYATPTGRIVVAEVADDGCIDFRAEQSGRIIASTRDHAPPMRPAPIPDDEQPDLLSGPALAWSRPRAETIREDIESGAILRANEIAGELLDAIRAEPSTAHLDVSVADDGAIVVSAPPRDFTITESTEPECPIADEVEAGRVVDAILAGVRECRAALRDVEDVAILERAWRVEQYRDRPRQTVLDMIAARASALGSDPATWIAPAVQQDRPEETPEAPAPAVTPSEAPDASTGRQDARAPVGVIVPPIPGRRAGPSPEVYEALRAELRDAHRIIREQSDSVARMIDDANASRQTIRRIAEELGLDLTPEDDARAEILAEIHALQSLAKGTIPQAPSLLDAIAEMRARGFRVSLTLEAL